MPSFSETSIDTKTLLDYLTCGQCAQEFPLKNITNFIHHKTVNCETLYNKNTDQSTSDIHPTLSTNDHMYSSLSCSSCLQEFVTARGLLHHVQFGHKLNIFISQGGGNNRNTIQNTVLSNVTNYDAPSENEVQEPSCCEIRDTASKDKTCFCRKSGQCISEVGSIKGSNDNGRCINGGGTTICCNSQECCVTIIPGTHEEPRKCCNSVVPKKRKLHMVKHMDKDYDVKTSVADDVSYDKASMIYIDLGSREPQFDDSSSRKMTQIDTVDISTSANRDQFSETINSNDSFQSDEDNNDQDSVIIETDRRFTIPIAVTSGHNFETNSINTHHIHVFKPVNLMPRSTQVDDSKIDESSCIPIDPNSSRQSMEALLGPSGAIDYQDDEDDCEIETGKKRRYPTSRPYKCDTCNDAFNQRIHLKKHMSKHTGVKPFKCQQCDYSTVERSHLKVHIRIHTGEKPFKCTHCEYATAQNSTLKIHLKRRHGGKMFQCESCSKMFTQSSMLENHQVEHQTDQSLSTFPILFQDINTSNRVLHDTSLNTSLDQVLPTPVSTNVISPVIGYDVPPILLTTNQLLPLHSIDQKLTNQVSVTDINLS